MYRWKSKKLSMNQKSLCIFVNSLLLTIVSLIVEILFNAIKVFGPESDVGLWFYQAFYLPYLWIISVYISYSKSVKTKFRSTSKTKNSNDIGKIKDCSVYAVESQV
uniref:DUF5671 domain-containing protein n=1 Tax=Caenorhabditis tropicalis TaxID=1561998 RepID=A0A1I7TVS3_9PELO